MKALGLLISILLVSAMPAHGAGAAKSSRPKTVEMFQGEVVEVKVSGDDLVAVEGRMVPEKIYFYPNGADGFSAIVGADVEAKPGPVKLLLKLISRAGTHSQREIPFKIKAKAFRRESFNVPPGFDQMSPEALEEIRRERELFARAFAAPAPERLWEAPFLRPVPHEASASSFGSRRIINGTPRAPHSGTDLSSPAGTEVVATNHGRVVLVGNFFFAGGSLVLDHGGGLFTMYFHLSEFKVEEGALVKKGDVLALSGATGRVTGAHLHWGARLANARIDPLELLSKVPAGSENSREVKTITNKTEK
ncbi:MAG TPA: M23 family metallopeptidase [Candidatus Deferrimicrobium sp.]|nr:M23 family metallopeptidase [Candidatus Deferrimicrobium sp.]